MPCMFADDPNAIGCAGTTTDAFEAGASLHALPLPRWGAEVRQAGRELRALAPPLTRTWKEAPHPFKEDVHAGKAAREEKCFYIVTPRDSRGFARCRAWIKLCTLFTSSLRACMRKITHHLPSRRADCEDRASTLGR
eukprot:366119-Chlamydomonas_euryale.AAC.11